MSEKNQFQKRFEIFKDFLQGWVEFAAGFIRIIAIGVVCIAAYIIERFNLEPKEVWMAVAIIIFGVIFWGFIAPKD